MSITSEQVLRHFIGFDRIAGNAASFPPHNIIRVTDDHYRLVLAVAGYTRADVQMYVDRGILTILGRKGEQEDSLTTYLHRGIATRDWDRQFNLGMNIEVVQAVLEDGLLVIDLERHVPEELRPKLIPIT